jgi:hypothetical protein
MWTSLLTSPNDSADINISVLGGKKPNNSLSLRADGLSAAHLSLVCFDPEHAVEKVSSKKCNGRKEKIGRRNKSTQERSRGCKLVAFIRTEMIEASGKTHSELNVYRDILFESK